MVSALFEKKILKKKSAFNKTSELNPEKIFKYAFVAHAINSNCKHKKPIYKFGFLNARKGDYIF